MKNIKIYIFCLCLLTSLACIAQEPAAPIGSARTAVKVLGRLYADSAMYLPVKPGNWVPSRKGAITFDDTSNTFKGWYGDGWRAIGGGGGSDELDTIVAFNGTKTSIALPHGLSYTPATASISIDDSSYGIPAYALDSTYIYLQYNVAPVGTFSFKISFHRRSTGNIEIPGGGGGGGGANNYTSNATFNPSTYVLTLSRSGLTALVADLTHTHPQSGITNLVDSLLSKANKTGTNAIGTWPISITGSATETDPKRLSSAAFSGTTTQTLTLTLADGTVFTPSFTQSAGGVTSFNSRTGAIAPTSGDYTTSLVPEGTNLYCTTARWDTRLALKTTADLAEGSNLYWTNARGDARITLQKGANSGLATLDGSGKVPVAQLPAGAQTYKGTWDASTNTPTLADGTGTAGDTYNVSVSATRNLGSGSIVWVAGDDAIYSGTIWQRNPSAAGGVTSVNSQTGVVTLTTTNIAEGTNLYHTDTRSRNAISVSGSIAYNAGTGVISYTTPTPITYTAGTNITFTGTSPNFTINSATTGVNTVFARSGNVTAQPGDYTATQITNAPAGGIAAVTVQAALNELDNEKLAKNTAITPGTYTKVVVDAGGLTTSGTTLVAADIPNLDIAKITTGTWPVSRGGTGLTALGSALQGVRVNAAATALEYYTTSSGTVTTFSSGNLSPLFTSSVANPTTTPAVTFTLSNAAANTVLGNNTNASAIPTYFTPTLASTLFKNQGTTTLLLHGNAAGNPSWGQVDLTADVVGVLPIASGGTNASTATAATNNLLPSQTSQVGKFLSTDGTNTSWTTPAGLANKAFLPLTDGATITWDYSLGFNAGVTISGNRTLVINSDVGGDYGTLIVTQDATGNRDITVPTGDKLLDGIGTGTTIDLPNGANAIAIISYVKRGTVRYWTKGWYH